MSKFITHIIISSCMLVFFTANDASASRSEFFFEYKEGMISLKSDNIPIMSLLEKITEVSSIEIFLIDDIDSRSITADFKDRSLEDALRSILKDCSYAILYFNDISSKGKIHTMSAYARKNNILPALAAGKAYRSKKRKISKARTNQVMDLETEREMMSTFAGKNNMPDLAAGKTYGSKKRKISKESTKEFQTGSHTPEQIKMLPSPIYSDSQSSSSSRGANIVPDKRVGRIMGWKGEWRLRSW